MEVFLIFLGCFSSWVGSFDGASFEEGIFLLEEAFWGGGEDGKIFVVEVGGEGGWVDLGKCLKEGEGVAGSLESHELREVDLVEVTCFDRFLDGVDFFEIGFFRFVVAKGGGRGKGGESFLDRAWWDRAIFCGVEGGLIDGVIDDESERVALEAGEGDGGFVVGELFF